MRAWPKGNPDLAHELNHRDWNHAHDHSLRERAAERAFDRLNPEFGVPADRSHRLGHHDAQQREAALALGVRVAIHQSRQNDRTRSYRPADAIHAARHQPARTRWGPERVGPER